MQTHAIPQVGFPGSGFGVREGDVWKNGGECISKSMCIAHNTTDSSLSCISFEAPC
jgi:hypothetical protein